MQGKQLFSPQLSAKSNGSKESFVTIGIDPSFVPSFQKEVPVFSSHLTEWLEVFVTVKLRFAQSKLYPHCHTYIRSHFNITTPAFRFPSIEAKLEPDNENLCCFLS